MLLQEPMKQHTSFRAGGPAAVFIEPQGEAELQKCLQFLSSTGTEFFILGNGSNLLVSDEGYDGVVLHMGAAFSAVTVQGSQITAGTGAQLTAAAGAAASAGLTGMEFAAGIPGSVGGGLRMNAGAYDGEMSHIVAQVRGFLRDGTPFVHTGEEMQFGYRSSLLKYNQAVATQAVLQLQPGDETAVRAKMADFNQRRREKQPLEYASAGSTFKRPEGYFAGKLIMDAGLRGLKIGGAQVSEKHCGFIINTGDATAADIARLIRTVQDRVFEQSGVRLEPEVIRLGTIRI